jgi:hypothetical protein
MQVKSVIADFKGKNKEFKWYLYRLTCKAKIEGFKAILDREMAKHG